MNLLKILITFVLLCVIAAILVILIYNGMAAEDAMPIVTGR